MCPVRGRNHHFLICLIWSCHILISVGNLCKYVCCWNLLLCLLGSKIFGKRAIILVLQLRDMYERQGRRNFITITKILPNLKRAASSACCCGSRPSSIPRTWSSPWEEGTVKTRWPTTITRTMDGEGRAAAGQRGFEILVSSSGKGIDVCLGLSLSSRDEVSVSSPKPWAFENGPVPPAAPSA
jgi:hypothetical protein